MVKILLDCYGGDNSPNVHIQGAVNSISKYKDIYIVLAGDENEIKNQLKDKDYDKERIEILHAPDVISPNDKPTDAIRLKKESSLIKSIRTLREDDTVDAMISTGSTGSLVAAATLRIGRTRGVIRPAFCPVLPTMNGGVVGICDSGANVDITPEYLLQFAVLSSLYMENVYKINNPRVALLNIGTEESKGDELRKQAYTLLKEAEDINFVGNMESRDLLSGKYDVIVCDGFSGNVLVKTTEGTALELLKKIKTDIYSKLINKIGALFMKKMFMEEKEFMNYQNYGGSVLLGTEKVIIKGHGSSDINAIEKCIEQAYIMKTSNLIEKTETAFKKLYKGED